MADEELEDIPELVEKASPYYKRKIENKEEVPAEEHSLVYDSSSEILEPVYFWVVDFMNERFKKVEKLVDNFVSTPGSIHFGEIGLRATKMQEEATKVLGNVNIVIKSILNIIYDLKEFQIRIKEYDAIKSKNKEEAEAALLALKQRWMDNVDIKRGRGSINMLAQELNFVTIRDAFMVSKNVEDVDKLDLNDRVKRILKPRVHEFFEWKKRSESEIKKRYEIEKSYLKSQVSALKLYSSWAKPYLRAVAQLKMKEPGREPGLVTVFNTSMFELTLLGKNELNVVEEAKETKTLPEWFAKLKPKRKYYSCVLVGFKFRSFPRQGAFVGRVDVSFKAYALNDDELEKLNQEIEKSDLYTALTLSESLTTESLEQMQADIDYFLKEPKFEDEEKPESEDVNPFSALFGFGKSKIREEKAEKKEKEEKKIIGKVAKDSYAENVIRKVAEEKAMALCFSIFDVYKKAHGMPSHPSPFE